VLDAPPYYDKLVHRSCSKIGWGLIGARMAACQGVNAFRSSNTNGSRSGFGMMWTIAANSEKKPRSTSRANGGGFGQRSMVIAERPSQPADQRPITCALNALSVVERMLPAPAT